MKEDIFININNGKNNTLIFPNYKNPIKYISLDKISTRNFDENFDLPFFTRANLDGLLIKYKNEEISFEVCGRSSILNLNLDLKYFKIGF
jgi:hypothetical protein